jgi:hypothetical protein
LSGHRAGVQKYWEYCFKGYRHRAGKVLFVESLPIFKSSNSQINSSAHQKSVLSLLMDPSGIPILQRTITIHREILLPHRL